MLQEIYLEIITRYMRMAAGQFLRDYRRDYHIQKSSAHRKAVLQRNEKAKERKMKVSLKEIEVDKSVGKRCSHIRLLALVNEIGNKGLMRQYTKKELHTLCDAYGVKYLSRWNKGKLSTALATQIAQCECMTFHQVTSTYAVTVRSGEDSTKIPILSLHRV